MALTTRILPSLVAGLANVTAGFLTVATLVARREELTGGAVVLAALVPSVLTPMPTAGQAIPASDTESARLTIERLYSLPNLVGTAPGGFSWSEDGTRLAFLWNREGYNFRDVWILDVEDSDGPPERVTWMPQISPVFDPDDPLATARAEINFEGDRGVSSVIWHPDGRQMLVTFRGDLWLVSPGTDARRVTDTRAPEMQVTYSPSGDALAFLRMGDVWLMAVDDLTSPPVRLTSLAQPDVRLASYRWSPDGSRIAVVEVDQRRVALRGIPDYLSDETRLIDVRRSYPGEAAGGQRIGLVDVTFSEAGRAEVVWIEMGNIEVGEGASDGGIPDMLLNYRWSPDGKLLAIDTSDFFAKDRRIFVVDLSADRDPIAGVVNPMASVVIREKEPLNETFYYWQIEWSTDSGLLYFLSDRDEDYHVWAVAPSEPSAEPRRLTSGPWAIASMHPVQDGLIVVGNRGNAEERHLFRVDNGGGHPVQLSEHAGTHVPAVSPDGLRAAVAFSSDNTPPELLLTQLGAERSERQITQSPVAEFSDYNWVEAEYVSFQSHVDGTTLHGRLTLPPDFDPSRTYPAILGSVYTESVRNQWGGRTAHPTWGLDQYLVQEGYVLLNVDMRGSWGRGRDHRRGIRLDYGGMDIEDLESGVRFLETLGFVDMDRVGLWGSSYGGLMTTMSLFRKPGLYAAGVAGAPATSVWHALTGQMAVMLGPEDSPAEYADSSPFMHADGLEDPLMIIHGMKDRVVLFKDTVSLVQRLILLGKDVDLVALPDSRHGWDNENLAQTRFAFGKLIDFFDRHLRGTNP